MASNKKESFKKKYQRAQRRSFIVALLIRSSENSRKNVLVRAETCSRGVFRITSKLRFLPK